MPETTTTPLAPMDPDAAFSAFRYLLAVPARDIDAAGEVANTEPQSGAERQDKTSDAVDLSSRAGIPQGVRRFRRASGR